MKNIKGILVALGLFTLVATPVIAQEVREIIKVEKSAVVTQACDETAEVTVNAGNTNRNWRVDGVEHWLSFGESYTWSGSTIDAVIEWYHQGVWKLASEDYVTRIEATDCPEPVAACTLPLYEKDGEWQVVSDGANGLMSYDHDSVSVTASGLENSTNYTLIEYPEPQTTWPWPVVEIVSGDTDASGNLTLNANYSVKAGEKYWIVKTDALVDGAMSGWNPSDYLFEAFVIEDNACLVAPQEPTPTPSQPDTTNHNSAGSGSGSAPVCSDSRPSMGIAHAAVTRLDGESALVEWTLHSGNQTHIIFGEAGDGWHHAALNVGLSGNFTVHGLHSDRTYDWQVIPMNGCAAGDRSPVVNNI